MKEVKCVLALDEKEFTTEKGEVIKFVDMKIKLDNGVSVPVKCSFKQDKRLIKFLYSQK